MNMTPKPRPRLIACIMSGLLLSLIAFGGEDGLIGGLPSRFGNNGGSGVPDIFNPGMRIGGLGGGGIQQPDPQGTIVMHGSETALYRSISYVYRHGQVHYSGDTDQLTMGIEAQAEVVLNVTEMLLGNVEWKIFVPQVHGAATATLIGPNASQFSMPLEPYEGQFLVNYARALYELNSQGLAEMKVLVSCDRGLMELTMAPDPVQPSALHVTFEVL